ncbi:MAG: hypothetical protein QNJ45_11485 [Ardenticatenaceae bacterium]|nr:hypothetical protein [Ardenticatenaceae bacterium]
MVRRQFNQSTLVGAWLVGAKPLPRDFGFILATCPQPERDKDGQHDGEAQTVASLRRRLEEWADGTKQRKSLDCSHDIFTPLRSVQNDEQRV